MMRVGNDYGRKISTVVDGFITNFKSSKDYNYWLKCEYGNKYCPVKMNGHTIRENTMDKIRLMDYRM